MKHLNKAIIIKNILGLIYSLLFIVVGLEILQIQLVIFGILKERFDIVVYILLILVRVIQEVISTIIEIRKERRYFKFYSDENIKDILKRMYKTRNNL